MNDNSFAIIPGRYLNMLTGSEALVFIALSWRANKEFQCWPSHNQIANDIGQSVTTVKRTLASLREKGVVTWEHRHSGDGDLSSNVYTLIFDETVGGGRGKSGRTGRGKSGLGTIPNINNTQGECSPIQGTATNTERCPKHQDTDNTPNCWGCKTAREAALEATPPAPTKPTNRIQFKTDKEYYDHLNELDHKRGCHNNEYQYDCPLCNQPKPLALDYAMLAANDKGD